MDVKSVFTGEVPKQGEPESLNVLKDFRRIYKRAVGNGREARLFGLTTQAKAEAALEKYAIDASGEGFYFEIPFTGEPRMDLLLQYNCDAIRLPIACGSRGSRARAVMPVGDDLQEEHGEVLKKTSIFSSFFEACAKDPAIARHLVGFSFDLSEDRDLPGIYLLPPGNSPNVDYVPAMLARLGASERLPKIEEAFAAAPPGWQPYYVGYMVARPGMPTRLGFYLDKIMCRQYRTDKALLERDLSQYYRRPIPKDMLDQIFLLTQKGHVWDFQFDMFPDGNFARALGVSVKDEAETNSWQNMAEFLNQNISEDLMLMLESWGLADERWRLLKDACSATKRIIIEGGSIKTAVDLVSTSTCKVRFKNEEALLAKSYIFAESQYL